MFTCWPGSIYLKPNILNSSLSFSRPTTPCLGVCHHWIVPFQIFKKHKIEHDPPPWSQGPKLLPHRDPASKPSWIPLSKTSLLLFLLFTLNKQSRLVTMSEGKILVGPVRSHMPGLYLHTEHGGGIKTQQSQLQQAVCQGL